MSAAALLPKRETNYTSVSRVTAYLRCPRAYQHRYILGTPPAHRPGGLAFGTAIHEALALHYATLLEGEEPPPVDGLVSIFNAAWRRELEGDVPVLLDGNDTRESLVDKAAVMLEVFRRDVPRPRRVLAVEEPFTVELHNPSTGEILPNLVGRIDAIIEDDAGRVRLLEHKTAARRFSETRLAFDLQATGYSYAARQLGLDATVTFQVLTKGGAAAASGLGTVSDTPRARLWLGGRLERNESYRLVLAVRRARVSVGLPRLHHVICKPKSIEGLMESLDASGALHLQTDDARALSRLRGTSMSLSLTSHLWSVVEGEPTLEAWWPGLGEPLRLQAHITNPNIILVEHRAVRRGIELLQAGHIERAVALLELACPEIQPVPPLELVEV